VRPGSVAVDAGANKGVYSWWLAKLCREVHAFEPNPAMFNYLAKAVPGNVKVYECALSNFNGKGTFNLPTSGNQVHHTRGSLLDVQAASESRSFEVEIHRLDDYELQDLSFIKTDVEGAELECLQGAEQTLRTQRPFVLAEATGVGGASRRALTDYMADLEYEAYAAIGVVVTPLDQDIALDGVNLNVLFQPRERSPFVSVESMRPQPITNAP
jgi:FkbM family methyltransferase